MRRRRTAEEITELVEQYRTSGMTRLAFCAQAGVARSTLDRYLGQRRTTGQRLLRVRLQRQPEHNSGFAIVLGNGRRIEAGWNFADAELARVIRVAEAG